MTFDEAVRQLYSFIDYERLDAPKYDDSACNLAAFRAFAARFGHPQDRFRNLHVGGTDGKGSVCRMLASILKEAGYRVGLYTSPHVASLTERIEGNGVPIREADFARLFESILPAVEGGTSDVAARSGGYATVFEILTVLAWLYFREQECDFAVNEVGMGGRLDATNILNPEVCGIGPIDLEHTHRLGKTLAAIAREKLGIVKEGVPVVAGRQRPSLRRPFRERARERNAKLVWIDRRFKVEEVDLDPAGTRFVFREGNQQREQRLGLFGRHQVDNALMARAMIEELVERLGLAGGGKDWDAWISRGLEQATNPARFERFRLDGRTVILDVAHTQQALRAVRATLDEAWPEARRVYVLGALQDKDVRRFGEILFREGDRWIATRASDNPRALSADSVHQQLGGDGQAVADPVDAVQHAAELADSGDLVVILGSLYLAGSVRQHLVNANW